MENSVVKEKKGLSRYRKQIVFLMDLFIVNFVYFVMIYWVPIRNGTLITEIFTWIPNLTLMIVCLCGFLWASKSYDSLWRYAETDEYISLIFMGGLAYVVYFLIQKILPIPKIPSVLSLCIYSMSLLLMMTARFIYRKYRMKVTSRNQGKKVRCAIIGAGNAGVALLNEMKNNVSNHYQPVCFFDDDPEKVGKFIHGIEVKGKIDMMPLLLRNTMVTEIIFAIPSANPTRRKEILEMCSTLHCHVKVLPDSFAAVQNENLTQNVRNVKIDDLLGRERVVFNNQEVFGFLQDKVIMVTGGGGSIGSELCRQIAKRGPKRLIVVDIYENNAYDLQQELKMEYGNKLDLKVEIASVRDREKVRELVGYYRPQIIFHAAAHKHVPLMEECPEEAVKNNVFGTYNVVHAADEFGVDKFVLISTDKAVNPTSVMGCTKRICEMLIQTFAGNTDMKCVAVRFGNVLGSHGSVIPLFEAQIKKGGPVTLTDPNIERYFMTIPEAAQLVLQAGALAEGGSIYVLDMGEPVKIMDLAKQLIRFYGYEPGVNMDIKIVGLRPGEKLYEELMMDEEQDKMRRTVHNKIFVAPPRNIDLGEFYQQLQELGVAAEHNDDSVVEQLAKMVPTFTPTRENLKL